MTLNHRLIDLLDQDLICVFCQKNLTWNKVYSIYACDHCYDNGRAMYIDNNGFSFMNNDYSFILKISTNKNFYWYIRQFQTPIFSNLAEGNNYISLKEAKKLYDKYINLSAFI